MSAPVATSTTSTTTAPTPWRGDDVEARIRDYLAANLPGASADLRLEGVQRIAVGWSHETWLFDAIWSGDDGPTTQGFCLRRDPGNALLRELSDLGDAVPGPALPGRHRRADPQAVLLRGRPRHPGRSVPRDGAGAGGVPQPLGWRRPALLRGGGRPRRPARQLHRHPRRAPHARLEGGRASTSSASPAPAPTSPAARWPSGGRWSRRPSTNPTR